MFPIQEFISRFQEILDELDEVKDQAEGETAEAFEEMNADFEDALFVIESIGDDEDWREAFSAALDEFEDLCPGYRSLQSEFEALSALADRLTMVIRLARENL